MTSSLPSVANNMEKSQAYKVQLSRYQSAVRQDFHFEGIFILYAMLEDRLSAFLFHAGVTNCSRDKLTKNKLVRSQLEMILEPDDGKSYQLRKISGKTRLIKSLLEWSQTYTPVDASTGNNDILYRQITRTAGLEEMEQMLDDIQEWCQARNELVHALLTRNPENLHDTLVTLTSEGYAACRKLDNFVKSFMKRNTIRKQFNIQ